jgi:hypothetical protein
MKRLALALALLSACGSAETVPAQPDAIAQVTYTCPMHPEVTSTDADADCSICGMDLVAQGDNDHSSHEH